MSEETTTTSVSTRTQIRGDGGGNPLRTITVQELQDLWRRGRGFALLVIFSLLLSGLTYLLATGKELSLLAQKDMLNMTVQMTVLVVSLGALILAADGFSGERERSTLEGLLLAPVPRWNFAVGKLVSALSIWVGAYLVSLPYLLTLSNGTHMFWTAIELELIAGTVLSIFFASFGLAVSAVASSNRTSLASCILVLLALVAPTQLAGSVYTGLIGGLFERANPVTAMVHFVDKILVSNHTWGEMVSWLASPVFFAVLAFIALVLVSKRLNYQGGLRA
ncbi:ABC transporter permease [Halocalculus aciditolerans]|uniref:Heme exporter protein B n=1 Tax=Halocalculus aciditolerans TaxID=1383812 RepID=A0A830FGA4_9EURY|nr:ABC transporter permease subunit [Halocalculus aciditolerans]GGL71702.1 heme exporter protein B [Halocalculus aciditolerans]